LSETNIAVSVSCGLGFWGKLMWGYCAIWKLYDKKRGTPTKWQCCFKLFFGRETS